MPSPAQDLAIIRQIMEDSQHAVRYDGKYFLAWGVLLLAGLLVTQAALVSRTELPLSLIWGVLLALGWFYSLWQGATDRSHARARTLSARLLAGVWIAVGISMTLIVALGLMETLVDPTALSGLLALLMGTGFYMTAYLVGTWLRLIAAGWWVGGAFLLVWPTLYSPLVFAGLLLVLQIAPALVVRQRARAVRSS